MKLKKNILLLCSGLMMIAGCGKTESSSENINTDAVSSKVSEVQDTSTIEDGRRKLNKESYYDKTYGGLLAELWGNFTGLPTEFHFTFTPNPAERVEWVVGETYSTDDDTSMEYVWTEAMERYGVDTVSYKNLRDTWMKHIQDMIWCGNLRARELMENGLLPPDTGSKKYNASYNAIDAQIESEIFGMLCPGNPKNAFERALWWMRAVGDQDALMNSAFYAALASELYINSDIHSAIQNVLDLVPSTASCKDVVSFVYACKKKYTDWRDARRLCLNKYYGDRDNLGAKINFAMVILALLYGDGDFDKTGQIACLAGFDNDCNCATVCVFMGILYGYSRLPEELKAKSGDIYNNTNRPGLPSDTVSNWAKRVTVLGDEIIKNLGGEDLGESYALVDGSYLGYPNESDDLVYLSPMSNAFTYYGPEKYYDEETRFDYGYSTDKKGEYLEVQFKGEEIHLFASRTTFGGEWKIEVDGKDYGSAKLKLNETFTKGAFISQMYDIEVKKIVGLSDGNHTLKLTAMEDGGFQNIEAVLVQPQEA